MKEMSFGDEKGLYVYGETRRPALVIISDWSEMWYRATDEVVMLAANKYGLDFHDLRKILDDAVDSHTGVHTIMIDLKVYREYLREINGR